MAHSHHYGDGVLLLRRTVMDDDSKLLILFIAALICMAVGIILMISGNMGAGLILFLVSAPFVF